MDCPYCLIRDPEQVVVFESDLVRFLQDRRYHETTKRINKQLGKNCRRRR